MMAGMPEKRARIALVTPYYRPVVGGVPTFVESLAEGLRTRGHDVRVWTRYGDSQRFVEAGPHGKRAFAGRVRRELIEWAPEVVHAHSHWYALAAAFRWGAPIAKRIVFSFHTEWSPPEGWIRERTLSRLLRRADVVTCVSAKRLLSLRARFSRLPRTELVYPGVRRLDFNGDVNREVVESLGSEERFPRLCVLSMMMWPDKVKGLELLVRSMPLILAKYPSATLIFVGDGPLRPRVEETVAAAGVGPHVRFAGVQENPAPFIAASDIALYCSFQDSFPQAVLECASMGRPVIVNQDVAEVFPGEPSDLGLVPVPSTPEGFARGVDRLASDDALRRQLGNAGEHRVEEQFDWQRTVDRFLDLYQH